MAKNASDVLIEGIIKWGVDVIFGLPGDGINGIMEALRVRQDEIRFISGFSLKAELARNNKVVWKDRKTRKSLAAQDVCEMMFRLLINQIKNLKSM